MNKDPKTAALHTPGPWVSGGHDGRRCELVASTWGTVAAVWPIGASDQESANARLIAAAPELLAALENIVGLWADSEQNNGLAQIMARDAQTAIARAKATA